MNFAIASAIFGYLTIGSQLLRLFSGMQRFRAMTSLTCPEFWMMSVFFYWSWGSHPSGSSPSIKYWYLFTKFLLSHLTFAFSTRLTLCLRLNTLLASSQNLGEANLSRWSLLIFYVKRRSLLFCADVPGFKTFMPPSLIIFLMESRWRTLSISCLPEDLGRIFFSFFWLFRSCPLVNQA